MKIVLLADADARQRAESSEVLKCCGCSVVAVRDASDALETFAAHHEDIALVIVDAELPVPGSASLLREIRKINREMPCLLTSSQTTSAPDARAIPRVIRVPLDVDELADAVPWIVPADRLHLGTETTSEQVHLDRLFQWPPPAEDLAAIQVIDTAPPFASLAPLAPVVQDAPHAQEATHAVHLATRPYQPATISPLMRTTSPIAPIAPTATATTTMKRAKRTSTIVAHRQIRRLVARTHTQRAARALGATAATAFCVALLVTHPEVRSLITSQTPTSQTPTAATADIAAAPVPSSSFSPAVFSMRPRTSAIVTRAGVDAADDATAFTWEPEAGPSPMTLPADDAGAAPGARRPMARTARGTALARPSRGARATLARSAETDEDCVGRGCSKDRRARTTRSARSLSQRLAGAARAAPRAIAKPFKALWHSMRRSEDPEVALETGGD